MQNYWDGVTYSTFKTHEDSIRIENQFLTFLYLLNEASVDIRDEMIHDLFKKRFLQNYIIDLAIKYLYDAESPFEDETLLIKFYKAVDLGKLSARNLYHYTLISKNQVEHLASDFEFETAEGRRMHLYDIKTLRKLLIFFDPECSHCEETLNLINSCPKINQMLSDGILNVILVYAEGNEQAWRKCKDNYPNSWIVGIDRSDIVNLELYDLKAIPTIYLLDENQKVIEKNIKKINPSLEDWI